MKPSSLVGAAVLGAERPSASARGARRSAATAAALGGAHPPAAGGKKITRSASRGTSAKSRTIAASRWPALGGRDRRPHAEVELAAKLGDQALLVLGELGIALGEQDVAMTGLHPHELHMQRLCLRPGRRPGDAEDVHGPGAAPEPAQAVADRLRGDLARPAGRVGELLAAGQKRGERRGVGAAGAVRGAVRVARAVDRAASRPPRRAGRRRPRRGRR